MSQAQPQKGSFLQTLLLFAVIFLGLRLVCPPPAPETRAPGEILKVIREHHAAYVKGGPEAAQHIAQISQEGGNLDRKLDELKLPAKEKQEMRVEALVLAADAQLKQGVAAKEFYSLQMAYQLLHNESPRLKKSELWNRPFKVDPTTAYARTEVSAGQLYVDLEKEAHKVGKTSLVWGFAPGYQGIDWLVNLTGAMPAFSYAFAALLLAAFVRAIVWPLAQKQYMWSRQMSQLQPLVKELRDKYQGVELNTRMMELYKKYGINPMAGCGPIFLQMPLFILIYNCMLYYRFEFQKGQFLWINPSTSEATNGFTAPNLGEQDPILLVLYGASMIVTTLLTPVSDPSNVKQQRLMGIGISVFFTLLMFTGIFPVPAAFVLYWIFTNVFATFQSLRAYRLPLPPLVQVQTVEGGMIPKGGAPDTGNGKTGISSKAFKGTGAPKLHKPKKKRK